MNEKEKKIKNLEPYFPLPEWLESALIKYKTKLEFTRLRSVLEEKKEDMDYNSIYAQTYVSNVQEKVKRILDKYGITLEWYPIYMAFIFQCLKVFKKLNPNKFGNVDWAINDYKRELKIVIQKWKMRGLDKTIMTDLLKSFLIPYGIEILNEIG